LFEDGLSLFCYQVDPRKYSAKNGCAEQWNVNSDSEFLKFSQTFPYLTIEKYFLLYFLKVKGST